MRMNTIKRNQTHKIIDHTFVICAYSECRFLEECVSSLMRQSVQSTVIMVTSTPNELISSTADRYGISVYINTGEHGITQDWNFGLSLVKTKYATIAHQDDVYESGYAETLYEQMESSSHPIIGFSDYTEIHGTKKISDSKLIKVKKLLLSPLKIKAFRNSKFIRRRALSLGCAICCPTVMFCMTNVQQPVFNNKYTCCEDWETWEKLSKAKGAFVYVPKPLMSHRIHEESVTTKTVNSSGRRSEDYDMYRKFWPAWIADILIKRYSGAEKYNKE